MRNVYRRSRETRKIHVTTGERLLLVAAFSMVCFIWVYCSGAPLLFVDFGGLKSGPKAGKRKKSTGKIQPAGDNCIGMTAAAATLMSLSLLSLSTNWKSFSPPNSLAGKRKPKNISLLWLLLLH